MNYNKILLFVTVAALSVLLPGCAKEKKESNTEIQHRILQSYLQLNYPNAETLSSGLVILDREPGTGGLFPQLWEAVYLDYTTKNLAGEYLTTTDKEIAKKMGTYSASTYYGPSLIMIGYGSISRGLSEALRMMNQNAKMTVIIPPQLTNYDSQYDDGSNNNQSSSINTIYELNVKHVVRDMEQFQIDSLESFKNIRYPEIDSVVKGFYFKKTVDLNVDTIASGTSANIWYVGKLLDGYVFDTNIADTAKKYGIYNSESDYTPLEVVYKSTYEEMSSTDESESSSGTSVIAGFAKAIKSLSYGESGVTFFKSSFGYDSKGSGSIPAYSMLFFDVYVDPEK